MSKQTKKSKNQKYDINIFAILRRVFLILFLTGLIALFAWLYFNVYKPQEKEFVKKSRFAFIKISDAVYEIYKEKHRVYDVADEYDDSVCEIIGKKLSPKKKPHCLKNPTGMPEFNFKINGTSIEIYGLERPGIVQGDNIIKEFIIDVNGEKRGANEVGIDRVPVQIHSTGRMGGKLMPVNCNPKDLINYNMQISRSCPAGSELNFLTSTVPFGFNVNQIGSEEGKIKPISLDVSFVRADCAAFGGEIIADDYCEDKGIYWLKRCYAEYFCGIEPAK